MNVSQKLLVVIVTGITLVHSAQPAPRGAARRAQAQTTTPAQTVTPTVAAVPATQATAATPANPQDIQTILMCLREVKGLQIQLNNLPGEIIKTILDKMKAAQEPLTTHQVRATINAYLKGKPAGKNAIGKRAEAQAQTVQPARPAQTAPAV